MSQKIEYKIKISKILADSDIDGVMCAAIISSIYRGCQIKFSDPTAVQEGRATKFVDEETVIMDLPYIDGCGLYFDHHPSNKVNKPFNGIWENTPSAARLVYEFYKDKFDLKNFEEILPDVDKFDSGRFKYEDVSNPSMIIKLAWVLKFREVKFFKYLVKLIAHSTLKEIFEDKWVMEKVNALSSVIDTYRRDIPKHLIKKGKIAFMDLREYENSEVHVSIAETELMDCEVVSLIKSGEYDTKFSLYQNNLIELPYQYDLLAIAKQINPQFSGGHKMGCGFTMPSDMTVEETIDTVCKLVKKQSVS
jgi:oligoribonuclease NrnB/cAMP/cGMP phosphodiesterase (DHH superfamily)